MNEQSDNIENVSKTRDYKVGDCKPPIEYQFKKGNPGGPGCPLGTKHFTNLFYKYANSKLTKQEVVDALGERFGEENVTRFLAYFAKLDQAAMTGDLKALQIMLSFLINQPKSSVDLSGNLTAPFILTTDDKELAKKMNEPAND